jgi:molybdopterin adenylyltransferase
VARIGVVTVSDRASQGVYEDLGGPAIREYLGKHITSEWTDVSRIVPDETDVVSATLIELADTEGCSLIVTTGGTGPALRDITPEATEAVCEKMMPGFGELDASSKPAICANRNFVSTNCWHSRHLPDREPARQTNFNCAVP